MIIKRGEKSIPWYRDSGIFSPEMAVDIKERIKRFPEAQFYCRPFVAVLKTLSGTTGENKEKLWFIL